MNTRFLFNASAILEILAGLALLIAPTMVLNLLLGEGVGPIGVAVARVLGVGLFSLGVAGWESSRGEIRFAPRAGLCIYNVGAAVVFVVLGARGDLNGTLLWPAAALHGLSGVLMLWVLAAPLRDVPGR